MSRRKPRQTPRSSLPPALTPRQNRRRNRGTAGTEGAGRRLVRAGRRVFAAVWGRLEARIAAVACLVCIIGFGVLVRFESESVAVAGKLQYAGNVTVQFRDSQHLAISPVCGCWHPNAGDWRGISFTARDLRIRRSGTTKRSSFLITAPEPGLTKWDASYLRVIADVYSFSLPYDSAFSPDSLLSRTWLAAHQGVRHSHENVSDLALVSAEPLNLRLASRAPLGAWIPAEGSTVVMTHHRDDVEMPEAHAVIEERYIPYAGGIEGDSAPYRFKQSMGFPLGDFLGPDVILWTDDPAAFIRLSDDAAYDAAVLSAVIPGQRRITAVVANSAFAIRVAVSPLGEWWERENARRPMWPGEPRDSGRVFVELLNHQIADAEYQRVYEWVKANEFTWVPSGLGTRDQLTSLALTQMSFRYPPVPNNAGFNIFGPLSSLRFDWTDGELNVGMGSQALHSAPLELRGIDSLRVRDATDAVPLRLHLPEGQAEFSFQARSAVSINGERPNLEREKTLQRLTVLFGLLGLVTGLISTVYAGMSLHQSSRA